MPEGDTIFAAAARLADVLVGREVVDLTGSHPGLRENGRRLRRHTVTAVESIGKHLLIHFDHGWSLRTHLGMPGEWHVYRRGQRWRRTPGKARVVVTTAEHVAVCFSAPTVHVGRTDAIAAQVDHLGPDLMKDGVDLDEIVRRAESSGAATVADLLLDQRVMAGLGNVYKSEVLFLEKTHPLTPVDSLRAGAIVELAERGRRLLRGNTGSRPRSTTGEWRRGQRTWVYGRGGRPCRRCGTAIASDTHGDLDRVTYWCPRCQVADS